jgi:hypothetical protein
MIDTITLPISTVRNTRKPRNPAAALLFCGMSLLVADGIALAYFADSWPEALILGLLCMPTGLFALACGMEARK